MSKPVKRGKGVTGPESRVMAQFGAVQVILQVVGKDSPFASQEEGKDVRVYIRAGRGAVALDLTALTRDELDAVGAILSTGLSLAEEVCESRDQIAMDKEEAGDDNTGEHLWRLYRRVPEVLVRNGEGYEHDPGLQLRSAWMARMDAFKVRNVLRAADQPGRGRSLLDGVE